MDTAHRRMEIISILSARGHATMRELAWELNVSRRTIMHDVTVLSFDYPIYTKSGEGGGVFITENYKPYPDSMQNNRSAAAAPLHIPAISAGHSHATYLVRSCHHSHIKK